MSYPRSAVTRFGFCRQPPLRDADFGARDIRTLNFCGRGTFQPNAQQTLTCRPAPSASSPCRSWFTDYRAPFSPERSRHPETLRPNAGTAQNSDSVESGELIHFSYRIVDRERSRTSNDKKFGLYLVSPAAHEKLVIPSLEKRVICGKAHTDRMEPVFNGFSQSRTARPGGRSRQRCHWSISCERTCGEVEADINRTAVVQVYARREAAHPFVRGL